AGPRALDGFRALGAATIGAVARLPLARLVETFGPNLGQHFHALACGRDGRAVVPDLQRKSIGRETTFASDEPDRAAVERTLLELVEEVAQRLRRAGALGQVVHVKLRTADFATVTRQAALAAPADTTEALWPAARALLAKADQTRQAIRLVGVSVSVFEGERQLGLFAAADDRHRRVAQAVDRVTARFGSGTIKRAAAVEPKKP
ncbi:MAG: DNA polymerase Y family protein, partial [Candidatus Binatia bacterium]